MPPASDGPDDEVVDGGRNVSCRLNKIVLSTSTVDVVEGYVQRVNDVVRYATEAIALLIHEDVEANVALSDMLPLTDSGMVNSMFGGVLDSHGANKTKHPKNYAVQQRVLGAFRRIHGAEASRVPGAGMGQLVTQEVLFYITQVQTSLKKHFVKRVERYVKLRLNAAQDAKSKTAKRTKEEGLEHAHRVKRVRNDACRPGHVAALCTDAADVALSNEIRELLRMDNLEWTPLGAKGAPQKKTLFDLIKASPQRLLPGMVALNKAFHAAGGRTFRVVPMRTSLMPKFITIDQRSLKDMGLVDKVVKRALAKKMESRRAQMPPFNDKLKALRGQLVAYHKEDKQADLARQAVVDAAAAAEADAAGKKRKKARKQPVSEEEAKRRQERDAPVHARIEAVENDPVYVGLLEGAANEKRGAFEAVFDVSKALSKVDAAAWKHSLKTDGVSVRLLLDRKVKKKGAAVEEGERVAQHDEEEGVDHADDAVDDTCELASKRVKRATQPPPAARKWLPKNGIVTVDRLCEGLQQTGTAPVHGLDEAWLTTRGALEQNTVLKAELERLYGGPLPITILGGDPGMWELLVLSNPDLIHASRKERRAFLEANAETAAAKGTTRYTLKQRRNETAPARYYLKKRHLNDPERRRRYDNARTYRHATLYPPDAVVAADRALSTENSKGPTAAALLAYGRLRSSLQPTLQPWHTDPRRRQTHWKAFIEKQRSFSQFCDRIRSLAIKQQGKATQIVIAYGAFGTSSGMGVKGLPPCIGKGLLTKLSREFLIVVVPEHYTSQRCLHCGGECGNHAYLADRDRRAQTDSRLEERLGKQLEWADTSAQRVAARQRYDRAMGHPCEIRGLRFCNRCKRCLNRDANSAPQMAVQLKRLMLGMGPLYKRDKKEEELDKLDTAVGA